MCSPVAIDDPALGVLLPHHRLLRHHVREQDPVHSVSTLAAAAGVIVGFTIDSAAGLMKYLGVPNTQLNKQPLLHVPWPRRQRRFHAGLGVWAPHHVGSGAFHREARLQDSVLRW